MSGLNAYIVDAVRTPVGRRGGGLAHWHPADLAAHTITATVDRTGIDPDAIEDVILGCVNTIGAQAGNIARTAWLSAGYPEHVPGVTVDRRCGSAQQALAFGAQAIAAGANDLVIVGGVEVMSLVPIGSPAAVGAEHGYGTVAGGTGWRERFGDQEVTQFRGAELIAQHWGLSREAMEEYALDSHRRAAQARDGGLFDAEIAAAGTCARDEGPRADASLARMAELPSLSDGGRLTAALASQISDGAASLLLAGETALQRHGLVPRARIVASVAVGGDPIMMLTAVMPATRRVLEKAGMQLADIDLFEVNEAFASVVMAWLADTGADPERTNVHGGAIALGHPLGATGARLMTTLLNTMERQGARYGMQIMCEGGGTANATIIERL